VSEAVIDAGELLDPRSEKHKQELDRTGEVIPGERGAADLKSARRASPKGARVLLVIVGAVVAVIVVVLSLKAYRMHEDPGGKGNAPPSRIERRVPGLKVAPLLNEQPRRQVDQEGAVRASLTGLGGRVEAMGSPSSESGSEAPPIQPAPASVPPGEAQTGAETVLQRRLSRGFGSEGAESSPVPSAPASAQNVALPNGALEEKLQATEPEATSAGMLKDRDYWLTQGAILDCVLETRIVSTVAGMTSCHLTRDVYSTNGRVVLLDRGTKLVGRYQAGMQQGENRIFVVWTRAETPNGVVVTLDSPGTGSLGEAGIGGWVDQHFWDRLGAAILVSLVQGATNALSDRAGNSTAGATVNVTGAADASRDVVGRTFESSINKSPTLYVNQGERIAIFVARDLNFRSVYELEPVARRDE
jgi:type IV secretion system protein VirB10